MFQKLPHLELATVRPARLFELLGKHVAIQVESASSCEPDIKSLAAIPIEAQTIYWLWRFSCEAEGSLIDGFLLQQQGIFTRQVHAALLRIGEEDLVERLEAGIPLALAGHAEFTNDGVAPWFKQFKVLPRFRTWEAVNKGCHPALFKKFRGRIQEYIIQHHGILIE